MGLRADYNYSTRFWEKKVTMTKEEQREYDKTRYAAYIEEHS